MRILVIEDEKNISGFIRQGLKENGYTVDVAADGEKGYMLASLQEYDAIILDIMIPKMDGITLCKKLRDEKIMTPVLMLSAKDSIDDKVSGLDSGAEDYLTKPFAFKELLARVRVLLRKNSSAKTSKLEAGGLRMDLLSRTVTRDEKEVTLTPREFALLEFLLYNKGKVMTRTAILEHIWDINYEAGTNVVDVHINALRAKVDSGYEKKLIQTVRGAGYAIKA